MTPTQTLRLGFRVLGSATSRRRLIDFDTAFAAYADCDDKAELTREAYLSAFTYGADFRQHLTEFKVRADLLLMTGQIIDSPFHAVELVSNAFECFYSDGVSEHRPML